MYHAVPVFRLPIGIGIPSLFRTVPQWIMMKAVCQGGRPSDGKALEEARRAYACKRPGEYFSGPFTARGCEEGWMLSVGCRAMAASETAYSCPYTSKYRAFVRGSPIHRKRGGVVPAESADCPRKEEAFFTAIRCRLFCPRWLPVVFCRTCQGAGGAGRAQRVCVDAGCPSHPRPSLTP